ncbi:MAG: hypothetical protein HC842_00805 [Cytophagales bacterium]|nr:hypothetical protein [Cytophagales bacterium]
MRHDQRVETDRLASLGGLPRPADRLMQEALQRHQQGDGPVQCDLCPRVAMHPAHCSSP